MKSQARPNQLITFTRCRRDAAPIEYRDLLPTVFNQTDTFELPDGIRDGWPLDPQHFCEQGLSDEEHVTVPAIAHHEQPTRQSLLKAVRPVACYRHHDLSRKAWA